MSYLQIYTIFTLLGRKSRHLLPGCCMTFYLKFVLAQSMFSDNALLRMITRTPALLFEVLEARTVKHSSSSHKSVVEIQCL